MIRRSLDRLHVLFVDVSPWQPTTDRHQRFLHVTSSRRAVSGLDCKDVHTGFPSTTDIQL